MNQETDVFPAVRQLVDTLRNPPHGAKKSLSRLTCAFFQLAWSARFGYGGLHLTSIACVLPESRKFKSSYKSLSRFLKCKFFDASSLAPCMLSVSWGRSHLCLPKILKSLGECGLSFLHNSH